MIVAGQQFSSGTPDIWVASFDGENGVLQWTDFEAGPAGEIDSAWDVSLDGQGNIYVVGSLDQPRTAGGTGSAAPSGWLRKYDADGVEQWTLRDGDDDVSVTSNSALLIAASGHLVVAADAMPSSASDAESRVLLRQFSRGGMEVAPTLFDPAPIVDLRVGAMTQPPDGSEIYLTGSVRELLAVNAASPWLGKYESGELAWSTVFRSQDDVGFVTRNAFDVAVDGQQRVVVVGREVDTATGSNIWAALFEEL